MVPELAVPEMGQLDSERGSSIDTRLPTATKGRKRITGINNIVIYRCLDVFVASP